MSLDIGPDRSRDVGQQASLPAAAPDPIEALSKASGVSAAALAALPDHELRGMHHLEQAVGRAGTALESGQMSQETYDATVAARDQIRAEVEARVAGPPDFPAAAQPAGAFEIGQGQAPTDARLTIRNNEVVIDVAMHLYGAAATPEAARAFELEIETVWNLNRSERGPWTYTDPEGKEYAVRFDAHVDVLDEAHPARRPSQSMMDALGNSDNYFEIVDGARAGQLARSGVSPHGDGFRANVAGGDEGQMRGVDGVGQPVEPGVAAHEFGHLLGFKDQYTVVRETRADGSTYLRGIPNEHYETNIMATRSGYVSQDMINDLLSTHVAARGEMEEYRTSITIPNAEDTNL